MGKVTIQDVANKLIVRNGLSKKDASRFANKMFDLIRDALERDKSVKVKGLGTFKIIDVDSRESVNVNTGERVLIEGHNKITFTPDALMKELVNKPFSQFETVVLNDGVDFKDADKEAADAEKLQNDDDDNEIVEMPLVDFIAPDPIVLGEPAEIEEPVKPAVSEPQVVKGTSVSTETPASHEEQVVSETPVVTEIPQVQVGPETLSQPLTDNTQSTDEPAEEEPVEEDEAEEEEEGRPAGGLKWPIVLLACVGALIVGYLLGNYFPWNSVEQKDIQEVVAPPVKKSVKAPVKEVAPPVKEEPKAPAEETAPSTEETATPAVAQTEQSKLQPAKQLETTKPAETPKPVGTSKPVEAPKPTVAATPAAVKLDKYEAMDARVRTGAYRIVGTDHVEKVKEGDNLKRIAKRTLGQDMECYLEVYNNLASTSELKKGQEIKIPKLELKKKKQSKSSR